MYVVCVGSGVSRVLEGFDLTGMRVLDIGRGAITLSLAMDHGAEQLVGEATWKNLCATLSARIAAEGATDRVTIGQILPGPFEFDNQSFGVVFSKDSIIRISAKDFLTREVFSVLRTGR
jgi:cyclopropane fatty-acyl-phospholipid synthase-like methyltransferase